MNTEQIIRQLQYLIRARKWAGNAANSVVFHSNSVVISNKIAGEVLAKLISPMCLIRVADAQSDPQHGEEPDLIQQNFILTIITVIPGEHTGTRPLIGGNRVDVTKSEGRGILEIEQELFAAVKLLTIDSGIRIVLSATGAVRAEYDETIGYIAMRDYQLQVWTTATTFYDPPRRFTGSGATGGQASLTWAAAPNRFDLLRYVLRWAAGSTPPALPTDGTGVTLSSALALSVTATGLPSGSVSFSLFAGYNDLTEGSSVDSYSSAVTKTVTIP